MQKKSDKIRKLSKLYGLIRLRPFFMLFFAIAKKLELQIWHIRMGVIFCYPSFAEASEDRRKKPELPARPTVRPTCFVYEASGEKVA